jgi:hypothetical protein
MVRKVNIIDFDRKGSVNEVISKYVTVKLCLCAPLRHMEEGRHGSTHS